jgi:hypothetical protein
MQRGAWIAIMKRSALTAPRRVGPPLDQLSRRSIEQYASLFGQSSLGLHRLAGVPSRGRGPRYRECHEGNSGWTLWQVRIRMR